MPRGDAELRAAGANEAAQPLPPVWPRRNGCAAQTRQQGGTRKGARTRAQPEDVSCHQGHDSMRVLHCDGGAPIGCSRLPNTRITCERPSLAPRSSGASGCSPAPGAGRCPCRSRRCRDDTPRALRMASCWNQAPGARHGALTTGTSSGRYAWPHGGNRQRALRMAAQREQGSGRYALPHGGTGVALRTPSW
jgi:hypothetical protein